MSISRPKRYVYKLCNPNLTNAELYEELGARNLLSHIKEYVYTKGFVYIRFASRGDYHLFEKQEDLLQPYQPFPDKYMYSPMQYFALQKGRDHIFVLGESTAESSENDVTVSKEWVQKQLFEGETFKSLLRRAKEEKNFQLSVLLYENQEDFANYGNFITKEWKYMLISMLKGHLYKRIINFFLKLLIFIATSFYKYYVFLTIKLTLIF